MAIKNDLGIYNGIDLNKYWNMIRSLAWKNAIKYKILEYGCTYNDLESVGYIGLINAIKSYNSKLGSSLNSWVYIGIDLSIRNYIHNCMYQTHKRGGTLYFDHSMKHYRNNKYNYEDLINSLEHEDVIIDKEALEFVYEYINKSKKLSSRSKDILISRSIFDITLEDLAKKYKVSKERIRQIYTYDLNKLKYHVKKFQY